MVETKKKIKLRKYTKKHCSPFSSSYKFSCFNKKSLIKIARAWNKKNTKNKIKINGKTVEDIWSQIDNRLKKKCNEEICWTQQEFVKKIKDSEIKKSFKPIKPKSWNLNKFEWLSTTDIENVIKQYENEYPNFRFIGAVPIDFDETYGIGQCIVNELCKINLQKMLLAKIFQIGIVFNLDKHDQEGSHWVSMFVDLKRNGIYYFDSYGAKEPKEIKKLSERLLAQSKDMGKLNMKYEINKTRHQFKNSECGVYCIDFIVSMLKGESFKNYTKNIVKDLEMNEKREIYFSPNSK
jgi:hypothetical protein